MDKENNIEIDLYDLLCTDKEIERFIKFHYQNVIIILEYIIKYYKKDENKELTEIRNYLFLALKELLSIHQKICIANTYIGYSKIKKRPNKKELQQNIELKEKVRPIYEYLLQYLSKNLCYIDKNRELTATFKQLIIYQTVLQNYFYELSQNKEIIKKLLYERWSE